LFADLIAVPGDPLSDVDALRTVFRHEERDGLQARRRDGAGRFLPSRPVRMPNAAGPGSVEHRRVGPGTIRRALCDASRARACRRTSATSSELMTEAELQGVPSHGC